MQKWEYGMCRIWGSYLLSEFFPPDGLKEFARTVGGIDIKGQKVNALDLFNKRGEEGWELVAMTPISGAPDVDMSPEVRAVFKRPKAG